MPSEPPNKHFHPEKPWWDASFLYFGRLLLLLDLLKCLQYSIVCFLLDCSVLLFTGTCSHILLPTFLTAGVICRWAPACSLGSVRRTWLGCSDIFFLCIVQQRPIMGNFTNYKENLWYCLAPSFYETIKQWVLFQTLTIPLCTSLSLASLITDLQMTHPVLWAFWVQHIQVLLICGSSGKYAD